MFEPLSVSAPAKLNLFLHITGRRPDGYHELQTLFQLLDYGDELHFAARADEQVTLSPALPGVAHDDNLITRAAHMLWPYRTVPCGRSEERRVGKDSVGLVGARVLLVNAR